MRSSNLASSPSDTATALDYIEGFSPMMQSCHGMPISNSCSDPVCLASSVPARARCVWSMSGLARQTCSERLDGGSKSADDRLLSFNSHVYHS